MDEIAERAGGNVVASGRAEVIGRGSELPWHEDVHYVLVFDGDKVCRLQMFFDKEEAEKMADAGG
jgi:hypothetical protein